VPHPSLGHLTFIIYIGEDKKGLDKNLILIIMYTDNRVKNLKKEK